MPLLSAGVPMVQPWLPQVLIHCVAQGVVPGRHCWSEQRGSVLSLWVPSRPHPPHPTAPRPPASSLRGGSAGPSA